DYIVGVGVSTLLSGELLCSMAANDCHIRAINGRGVADVPATCDLPVVSAVGQAGGYREVTAGVCAEAEVARCPAHAEGEGACDERAVRGDNSLPRQVPIDDTGWRRRAGGDRGVGGRVNRHGRV